MEPIEQALIFFSAEEDRFLLDKIRTSGHVLAIDLDEILGWAESLKMRSLRFNPMNLLFHPLPSGRFGLGRVRSLNNGENAPSFVWQYAVIDPERMLLFGNNPISLFQKTLSAVRPISPDTETTPEPFFLEADGRFFNAEELRALSVTPGIDRLSALVDSILTKPMTLLTASVSAPHLISAALNLLPVDYRTEISLSCELDFTGKLPLRLAGFSQKQVIPNGPWHRMDTDEAVPVRTFSGWSRLVYEVLRSGAFDFFEKKLLADHLAVRRNLTADDPYIPPCLDDLDRLGNKLRRELACTLTESKTFDKPIISDTGENVSAFRVRKTDRKEPIVPISISEKLRRWLMEDHSDEEIFCERELKKTDQTYTPPLLTNEKEPIPQIASEGDSRHRSRIPHEEPLLVFEGRNRLFSPFQQLLALRPDRELDLRELDSLVGRTLTGDKPASNALLRCWERILTGTDTDFVETIREEYIRFIRSILVNGDYAETDKITRTVAACDILDLFLNTVPNRI